MGSLSEMAAAIREAQPPPMLTLDAETLARLNRWEPDVPYFAIALPAPPSANNLTRGGRFGSYPTKEYKAWLLIAEERLERLFGAGHAPDTKRWWTVHLYGYLPTVCDVANYEKATLDLLEGARFDQETGKVRRALTGLYDNDKRVRRVSSEKVMGGVPRDCMAIYVKAWEVAPPLEYKAWAKEQARQSKLLRAA